ncbi:hypothetical protein RB195_011319 [Necator americanus]|uniref:UBA/TS-N domain protein n=1 Tax=Necator americanus TaxID=51031 RepID=A0ABR1D360_NECAM
MAAPQRFPLPNMPFRREVHSGCAIGTSISLRAQAFQAKERSFTIQLSTAKDIAVLVTVPIAKNGRMAVCARVGGKFSSEVDKPFLLPYEMKFTLHLRLAQFATEIYFNDNHMLDFVHRVNPAEIKEVHIEGPLIVEEVVFTPPQGSSLDPVPSYEQATNMGSDPIKEFRHLEIGPPSSSLTPVPAPFPGSSTSPVLIPTPGPPQIGLSSSVVNQPIAGIPLPSASTSTNPFVGSSSGTFPSPSPAGQLNSKSAIYEKNPQYVPTAFEQAQRYGTPSSTTTTPYYVTSPTPTPTHTPAPATSSGSSAMPVLQPTSFQAQPLQPTPYPSSSQALQPIPSYGPTTNTPYPQVMPQPHTSNQPFPTAPGMNPYGYQQYPTVVPGPQGMPMQPHYNPYQQQLPLQYTVPSAPYVPGYAPQHYPGYPVVYGSGCHIANLRPKEKTEAVAYSILLLRIALKSRRTVQENNAKQSSSDGVGSKDPHLNLQQSSFTTSRQRHSSILDASGMNFAVEETNIDQTTIQLLIRIELIELLMQNLSKKAQPEQGAVDVSSARESYPEFVKQIQEQLPRLAGIARSPEVTSALKNPRVLMALRNIQLSMSTIQREAPMLVEAFRSRLAAQSGATLPKRDTATSASATSTCVSDPVLRREGDANASRDTDILCLQYEGELDKLAKMGFTDKKRNLTAIRASNGSIEDAVDFLLNTSELALK